MATNGTSHSENLTKDEVGWYFVEQYYTTLSKSPSRLHLFYGKKSQFVSGIEGEPASSSVGRQDIQERIVKLDFQDCKVRVSSVDTQASLDNIVIQVIGEISNKSEEPRKFVQTFVLAEQPSGYFVLNDILRYIKEEDEAAPTDAAAAAAASQDQADSAADQAGEGSVSMSAKPAGKEPEAAEPQLDAAVVDEKLEEAATAAAVPKEPPKPMTWASRAAAAAGPPRPVVALPKPAPAAALRPAAPAAAAPATAAAAAAAAAATTAAPAASGAAPAAAATSTPAAAPAAAPATKPAATAAEAATSGAAASTKDAGSEWQTAGVDSRRQNRPQSISGPAQDKDTTLGYVKYVTDKVEDGALRSHLESFGAIVYFDINRAKNCAFVEFATSAGYQAAVAANPHTINGENILVEARRPKASAYGGANYTPNHRGGMAGRGRGGYEGRNGIQGGGRGGYPNRGRGGAGGASRGRGGAPNVAA